MGRLNKVIKELEVEYKRIKAFKGNYSQPFSRTLIKKIIKANDYTLLKEKAEAALKWPKHHRPRAKKYDAKIRKANPGIFDIVFVNKHTKEVQLLTMAKGIYYDVALNYLNYVTDYQTEICNELGHYEMRPHEEAYIPKELQQGL